MRYNVQQERTHPSEYSKPNFSIRPNSTDDLLLWQIMGMANYFFCSMVTQDSCNWAFPDFVAPSVTVVAIWNWFAFKALMCGAVCLRMDSMSAMLRWTFGVKFALSGVKTFAQWRKPMKPVEHAAHMSWFSHWCSLVANQSLIFPMNMTVMGSWTCVGYFTDFIHLNTFNDKVNVWRMEQLGHTCGVNLPEFLKYLSLVDLNLWSC